MSAFLVDERTINIAIMWLENELEQTQAPVHYRAKALVKEYDIDTKSIVWQASLASAMFALNCEGVNTRYPNHEKSGPNEDFTFKRDFEEDRIQVLKSIQCWLYQCTESEEIEKTPLYRFWTEIVPVIAVEIVSDLPAYGKAKWG